MNEDAVECRLPGSEPAEDTEQTCEGEAAPPIKENPHPELTPHQDPNPELTPHQDPNPKNYAEAKEEVKTAGGEPPMDWFEPLEEDDYGDEDPEEESLAGESERSESVAGSEKTSKKLYQLHMPRRRRAHPDEGWIEWPALGEGWKRKEVVRRSGSSMGQKDVYYLSPRGDRVRSRVELTMVLQGHIDLSHFEYKTGKFYEGEAPPVRLRGRGKRKVRERSSSESSFMERGEGADTPDSYHRLTPSIGIKHISQNQTSVSFNSLIGIPRQSCRSEDLPAEDKIKLPFPPSSRSLPLPSINGEIGSEDSILVCAKCGISFTGTWYDKQRKRPCCPSCWAASKTKEHPMIRFRKWIPCGQCVGCHNTVNCGQCANCKHGLQSPESRRRICRKRRCICPIRKSPGSGNYVQHRPYSDIVETFEDTSSFQSEVADSQQPSLKNSDTENFSVNVDLDEDEMSTDDDDDWHKKRKRRSCGECKACLCRKDCGTCDFCIDKPKFGGSNKKRQKCRLRQCQRQAMRHLLPFQMGQSEFGQDAPGLPGRPRPHYTYSRKPGFKRIKGGQSGLDFTDEDDDSNLQPLNHSDFGMRNGHPGHPDRVPHISNLNQPDQHSQWDPNRSHVGSDGPRQIEDDDDDDDDDEEEDFPMITQIFSLAENPSGSGADMENQLMKLLHGLRSSVLPILWYAIVVEGPQLQLIQCSKRSNMADTTVLIDPGFCYQVTVQKQPLLPTHSLYDTYPTRLTTVTEVVNLLLGLEKYVVCHGIPPKDAFLHQGPIILERASTCDFLVKKSESVCANCRALQRL